jgi:hypothetical protein
METLYTYEELITKLRRKVVDFVHKEARDVTTLVEMAEAGGMELTHVMGVPLEKLWDMEVGPQ